MGINTFPLGISFCLAIGARDIDQIEVRLNARSQFRSKIRDFGLRAHSSGLRAVLALRTATKCLISIYPETTGITHRNRNSLDCG